MAVSTNGPCVLATRVSTSNAQRDSGGTLLNTRQPPHRDLAGERESRYFEFAVVVLPSADDALLTDLPVAADLADADLPSVAAFVTAALLLITPKPDAVRTIERDFLAMLLIVRRSAVSRPDRTASRSYHRLAPLRRQCSSSRRSTRSGHDHRRSRNWPLARRA